MSFYPDVNPGQNFEPSAQLENDVRRLVNRGGLSGVRANGGGMQVENICINAINPGSEAIPSGACIVFQSGAMVEGCVPVEKISDLTEKTWGIAMDEIPSSQFGSVLVMGAAVVNVSGGSGDYIVPTASDGVFTRSDSGSAKVLREITDGAIVLVGVTPPGSGSAPAPSSGYDGPFKVDFLSCTSAGDIVVSVHGGHVIGEDLTSRYFSGGIVTYPSGSLGAGSVFLAGSQYNEKISGNATAVGYSLEVFGGYSLPRKYTPRSDEDDENKIDMFSTIIATISVVGSSATVTQLQSGNIYYDKWNEVTLGLGWGLDRTNNGKSLLLASGNEYHIGGAYVYDNISEYQSYTSDYETAVVPSVAAMLRFVRTEIYNLVSMNPDLYYPYYPQAATPSGSPTISASTNAPTNGTVTITANFSNDTTVKSYRIGYGDALQQQIFDNWMPYFSPVVVSSNATIQFMAQKESGGMPLFASYRIANINKEPPAKPRITVNITSRTTQNVKVYAEFTGEVMTKEYQKDGGAWVAYTGAVVFTENGTVTFRATDYAGNSSTEYYVVENIESSGS